MAQQNVRSLLYSNIPTNVRTRKGYRIVRRPALDVVQEAAVTTIVSLRPPQYGLPLAQRVAILRSQLPNGVYREIILYSSMPTRVGIGGVECSGSGYARVVHQQWRDVVVGGFVARRANSGPILFPELTGELIAVGWGALDADGVLQAFGLLRNEDGTARVWTLGATDQPRFNDGDLQTGLQ